MKKNKNKEDKRERAIKILKIVGSALGLTLCTAGFVVLLTIGVRGCAHQSTQNDVQLVKREEKKLSKRQLNNVVAGVNYLNTKAVWGYNNANMYHAYNNSDDMDRQFPYKAVVTYNNESYNITNAYVHTEFEMDFTFELLDTNGQAIIYGSAWDTGEDSLEWDQFESEVWQFNPVNKLVGYLTINQLVNYDNNIAVDMLNAFYEDYFTAESDLLNVDFIFNDVINPFGPFGGNFDYFIERTFQGQQTIFNGLFKDSNGVFYKEMRMYFVSATGQEYGSTTTYKKYTGSGSKYVGLYYVDFNNEEVFVNGQDYGYSTAPGSDSSLILLLSNRWTSAYFKNITIYTSNDNGVNAGLDMDYKTRLSTFNNVSTYYSGVYDNNTGVMGNVFALLKGAFSSWLPIFNIQVLPGIALGVFVFLPLVVMVVLFIVWLFKR